MQGGSKAWLGSAGVGAALLAVWILTLASLRHKSLTYDEVAHAAGGYSYWRYGDYRLQPENGQLPQRLAGLPLALGAAAAPAPEPGAWHEADVWRIADQWLFRSAPALLATATAGRWACSLFVVATGLLVWLWSKRLFGAWGAGVSLLLYGLSPTVLANGGLMTSDMAATFFFLAALWAIWGVLEQVTAGRVALSALAVAGLFLSKFSAPLLVAIALLLGLVRIFDRRPLPVRWARGSWSATGRAGRLGAIAAAVAAHALVVTAIIWGAYGFRYRAFAPGMPGRFRLPWEYVLQQPDVGPIYGSLGLTPDQQSAMAKIILAHGAAGLAWTNPTLDADAEIRRDVLTPGQQQAEARALARPPDSLALRAVQVLRAGHVLPEAWLYGLAESFTRAQFRLAFLNGEVRTRGWRGFFPYSFLVKTPLPTLALLGLAIVAYGALPRPWAWYWATFPLLVFIALYGSTAIASHLNIGQRHLLPLYPALFVLAGALGDACVRLPRGQTRKGGARPGRAARLLPWLVAALGLWLAQDVLGFFPNYLAYTNGLIAPREAFRHLGDSSLDWGQELPAVADYVRRLPAGLPVYLSYFGTASPAAYGVRAHLLYSVSGVDYWRRPDVSLVPVPAPADETVLAKLRQDWPDHEAFLVENADGSRRSALLVRRAAELKLAGGLYIVGASMLQPVNYPISGPWGHWTAVFEARYRGLAAAVAPLLSEDAGVRAAALGQRSVEEWEGTLADFETYRFARLSAFLRHRRPDDEINYAMLVFRLSDADLTIALEGPPAELAPQNSVDADPG